MSSLNNEFVNMHVYKMIKGAGRIFESSYYVHVYPLQTCIRRHTVPSWGFTTHQQ